MQLVGFRVDFAPLLANAVTPPVRRRKRAPRARSIKATSCVLRLARKVRVDLS